jgi:hypothetical protein
MFALWGQFMDHWARADMRRARRLAAELRELGETAGDVLTQVMGCHASELTCFCLGEFTAGRAYMEKGLALYDPAHPPSYSELMSNGHVSSQDENCRNRTRASSSTASS